MDATADLVEIGFSQNEAKVYLTLLELGEARTGKLCERTKVPNSHIYDILEKLLQKGVISYKLANGKKVFKANSPETLNVLFLKKQQELEQQRLKMQDVIAKLKATPKQHETLSDYQYFEGIGGIKAMWLQMAELYRPETTTYIYTGTAESIKALNTFYLEEIHKKRVSKKVKELMILPLGAKELARERKKIGLIEIRHADIATEAEFAIYEEFLLIQYTSTKEKNPRGFLIKDRVFSETFKGIFEKLWTRAKE